MYEVQAIASFDHHGSRKVGDRFTVGSQRQAEELEKKGLVQVLGSAPEMGSTAASTEADSGTVGRTGSGTAEGSTSGSTTPTPGELLVGGNAPDVITSLAGLQDKAVLQSALDAEKAGKDRKTVVEALEAALKAD
ncbi:hypothetical protein [Stenotrophomonas rhizophila]|uniref:hypothetical protein n=1 Tax=Stenotrophomonas rhizophila TaxID=216778 RepID=UPI001AEC314E|nr:hypothetical protein [Stenotrophomonas rhizophila]